MTRLTNAHTGHSVEASDEASERFWSGAGYVAEKSTPAKEPAKKSAAKKSSKK